MSYSIGVTSTPLLFRGRGWKPQALTPVETHDSCSRAPPKLNSNPCQAFRGEDWTSSRKKKAHRPAPMSTDHTPPIFKHLRPKDRAHLIANQKATAARQHQHDNMSNEQT